MYVNVARPERRASWVRIPPRAGFHLKKTLPGCIYTPCFVYHVLQLTVHTCTTCTSHFLSYYRCALRCTLSLQPPNAYTVSKHTIMVIPLLPPRFMMCGIACNRTSPLTESNLHYVLLYSLSSSYRPFLNLLHSVLYSGPLHLTLAFARWHMAHGNFWKCTLTPNRAN